jgi:ribonuclease BN (tRNA processing enzyme)
VRYGGHTSCVAISHDGQGPSLVLDGGTGLRRLARHLDGGPFRGTILLGHLHWDHMQGLPFFPAADHAESRTTVLVPTEGEPVDVLAEMIGRPHFPLRPDELRGDWTFRRLQPGTQEIEGFTVTALDIPHLGDLTFGFRVSDGSATVAYLSDHSPTSVGAGPAGLGEYHPSAKSLVDGVDALIHDAQHLAAEFPAKAFLGHATAEYAVGLGRHCGARRVLLYHHDPNRTDDEIDATVAAYGDAAIPVSAAAEGEIVDLP